MASQGKETRIATYYTGVYGLFTPFMYGYIVPPYSNTQAQVLEAGTWKWVGNYGDRADINEFSFGKKIVGENGIWDYLFWTVTEFRQRIIDMGKTPPKKVECK